MSKKKRRSSRARAGHDSVGALEAIVPPGGTLSRGYSSGVRPPHGPVNGLVVWPPSGDDPVVDLVDLGAEPLAVLRVEGEFDDRWVWNEDGLVAFPDSKPETLDPVVFSDFDEFPFVIPGQPFGRAVLFHDRTDLSLGLLPDRQGNPLGIAILTTADER